MENKNKLFISIIIGLIICIIIITIALIAINSNIDNKEKSSIENVEDAEDTTIKEQIELTTIKEIGQYYNGLHYIKEYLNRLYYEEQGELEVLPNIIYTDYNKQENIEKLETYLNSQIEKFKNSTFYAQKAYYKDFDINHALYIYEGKIVKNQNLSDWCCGLLIDYENMAYLIVNGDSVSEINSLNLKTEIEKNDFNAYEYYYAEDEEIVREIFNNFKFNIKYNSENIYNKLNEEYKQIRFNNNIESFYNYRNKMSDKIENCAISGYKIDNIGEERKYIIQDNYKNQYVFLENGVLDYSVMLDSYSIQDNDYRKKYNSLDNESKVNTNIDMFIKMINTKDYEHAYQKLDITFGSNNFGNVEKFEEYMQSNFYENNIFTINTIEQRDDLHIVTVNLYSDSSSAADSKEKTFIVKLGEGTEFTMSFNI